MATCCGASSDLIALRNEMEEFLVEHQGRVAEFISDNLEIATQENGSRLFVLPIEKQFDLIREIIPTYTIPENMAYGISQSLTYLGTNVIKYILNYFYRKTLQEKWQKVYSDNPLANLIASLYIGPRYMGKVCSPIKNIDLQIDDNKDILDDGLADVSFSLEDEHHPLGPYGYNVDWSIRIDDGALFMKVFYLKTFDYEYTHEITFTNLLRGHLLSLLIEKSIKEVLIMEKDAKCGDGYIWNKQQYALFMEKDNLVDVHMEFVISSPDAENDED